MTIIHICQAVRLKMLLSCTCIGCEAEELAPLPLLIKFYEFHFIVPGTYLYIVKYTE